MSATCRGPRESVASSVDGGRWTWRASRRADTALLRSSTVPCTGCGGRCIGRLLRRLGLETPEMLEQDLNYAFLWEISSMYAMYTMSI